MTKPFDYVFLSPVVDCPPAEVDAAPHLNAALAIEPWLRTLTHEEWTLLRDSPRCTTCGHLLVLRKWPEYLPCCALPDCPCEIHAVVDEDGPII